tara:strand:- start:2063 stop:2590 length:528 start_codon:yes stop_codon:yes gene_type:complete
MIYKEEIMNNIIVVLVTTMGTLEIELYEDDAPITVKNFVSYVESGFFEETIFHRIIPGFVVQGGGHISGMEQKETQEPIQNEANNGLKNDRYTLSMARTNDPNSATSQFFINLQDNISLDFSSETPMGWGYAVFGKVVKGQEVVDKMATVQTGSFGPYQDVPREDIKVLSATLKK